MEFDFLILADSVDVANNKLYMLGGGWDQLTVGHLPAFVRLGIAIGLLVQTDEQEKNHQLQLVILAPEGKVVMQMDAELGANQLITAKSSPRLIFSVNVGLQLPISGTYRVVATVDSDLKRETVFRVVLVAPS